MDCGLWTVDCGEWLFFFVGVYVCMCSMDIGHDRHVTHARTRTRETDGVEETAAEGTLDRLS